MLYLVFSIMSCVFKPGFNLENNYIAFQTEAVKRTLNKVVLGDYSIPE